ncbi:MAG TPA: hypothetical protein VFZ61_19335, partial [Polyangiales bacterium]
LDRRQRENGCKRDFARDAEVQLDDIEGVTDATLDTLEALRREAVESARRQLAEGRAELSQYEALYNEASSVCARAEQSLQSERSQFGDARSVARLRWVEERVRGLEHEVVTARTRRQRALQACAAAREQVERLRGALFEAERARLAVGKVLETRRELAERARERGEEEQAEDAWRGRR